MPPSRLADWVVRKFTGVPVLVLTTAPEGISTGWAQIGKTMAPTALSTGFAASRS